MTRFAFSTPGGHKRIVAVVALFVVLLVMAPIAAAQRPARTIDDGIAAFRRGQLQLAEHAFRRAILADPDAHVPRQWLAAVLYQMSRYSEAVEVLRPVAAQRPNDPHTWLWFGYALAGAEERTQAHQALVRVILLAPDTSTAEQARAGMRALGPLPPGLGAAVDPKVYRDLARWYNPKLSEAEAKAIAEAIVGYSAQFNVDPRLIAALIVIESSFIPHATSYKGAMGLGQLMPQTAASLGVHAYDPTQNVYGTVRVMRANLDRFGYENIHLALAAYNAGRGAVERYGGIPPYQETRWYVYNVMTLYRRIIQYAVASN